MMQTDSKTPRGDREEFQVASGDTMKSVDRNMVYADGAIKLAKPLVSPLAISYTLLEKRE